MSEDFLRDEHHRLKAEARAGRREFAKSVDSAFVKDMRAVMVDYANARAEGMTRDDACGGIEAVLRGAWPKPTTKFPAQCETCDDMGWRFHFCTHETRCGRHWCGHQHPAHEHVYVEPCGCPVGDTRRKRLAQVEDEIAAAGRMTKRKTRGWSAVGH